MNKHDVLAKIREVGLVPVIRAESPEAAGRAIDAIRAGGVPILEITMTVPGAIGLIEDVARKYGNDAVVGAGTVTGRRHRPRFRSGWRCRHHVEVPR